MTTDEFKHAVVAGQAVWILELIVARRKNILPLAVSNTPTTGFYTLG